MTHRLNKIARVAVVFGLSAFALGCTDTNQNKYLAMSQVAQAKASGASEQELLEIELWGLERTVDEKSGLLAAGSALQDGVFGTADQKLNERAAAYRSLFLAFTPDGKRIVEIKKRLAVIEAMKNTQNAASQNIINSPRIPSAPSRPQPCGADSDCSI